MDKQQVAVLLSFTLYALYVFLPIVPAILIYKMFPNSQISASGVLSNFKFNATGAFGGYVITVVLGWGLVDGIHGQIVKSANPSWTIKAKLKILDENGESIFQNSQLENLKVKVFPELVQVRGGNAIIKLPGHRSSWNTTLLEFHLPGHGLRVVDLGEASSKAIIDEYNLTISFIDPVEILKTVRNRSLPTSTHLEKIGNSSHFLR